MTSEDTRGSKLDEALAESDGKSTFDLTREYPPTTAPPRSVRRAAKTPPPNYTPDKDWGVGILSVNPFQDVEDEMRAESSGAAHAACGRRVEEQARQDAEHWRWSGQQPRPEGRGLPEPQGHAGKRETQSC